MHLSFAITCALAASAYSQSLLDAISLLPQLSEFTDFYKSHQVLAEQFLSNSSTIPHTVLVPNNDAFAKFASDYGKPVESLSLEELQTLLSYHILVSDLTMANFSQPNGLIAPSMLVGDKYNNRTAGAMLSDNFGIPQSELGGQVVFISNGEHSTGLKFRIHRSGSDISVRSGLSSNVNLTALDVVFDGGRIQEIDAFLTIPKTCSDTIRSAGLSALDNALNRTNLWDALNTTPNVTCLGPNNKAFSGAGNPDENLDGANLTAALLFHTIAQPLYSTFLEDGMVFQTLSNDTVMVTVKNGDIFFNDAKVINANVLTNNGLIHELDKVMSPLNTTSSPPASVTSPTTSQTSTSTPSTPSSTTSSGAANARLGPTQLTIIFNVFLSLLSYI